MKFERAGMNRLYIAMYHYVRDLKNSRYPNIKGLDLELFRQQIDFFSKQFNVITMEELIAYYQQGEKLPDNAMLLTFDDGYIDDYTNVLPVLHKYKMQGSFFVPAKVFKEHSMLDVNKIHFILAKAPIDKLVNSLKMKMDEYRGTKWDYPSTDELYAKYAVASRFDPKEVIFIKRILQVVLPEDLRHIICDELYDMYVDIPEDVMARELYVSYDQMKVMKDAGMFFGIHGYDHYWMNHLSAEEFDSDVNKALDSMQGLVDKRNWVINYPYGSYSDEVIARVKDMGCVLGLSTDVGIANIENTNRYMLPRLDCNDFPPKSDNYERV